MVLWFLVICHMLAAGLVTGHVLLTKADARAIASWLAIVWFSPLVGSLGYLVFGINRIARRANRLRTASRIRRKTGKFANAVDDNSSSDASSSGIIRVGDELSGNQP